MRFRPQQADNLHQMCSFLQSRQKLQVMREWILLIELNIMREMLFKLQAMPKLELFLMHRMPLQFLTEVFHL